MRRIFVISCLLIITILIWAGIYARTQGFTNSWRTALERDLEGRGYYANVGKLTLGAFRGLVAEDVILFADPSRQQKVASINDVFIDVGLQRILSKKLTINTLEIQNGQLSIPTGEDESVQINNLSGRFALTENLIEVVRLRANFSGVKVSVKGALFRSPNERSGGGVNSAEAISAVTKQANPNELVKKLYKLLESLEFEAFNRPELTINFRGDIRELNNTQFTATLVGENIREVKTGYTINELDAKAEFDGRNGRGEITKFELVDEKGTLSADARWFQDKKEIDVAVDSSADIKTLLNFFFPDQKWSEIVFFTPPRFRAEGTIALPMIGKRPPNSPAYFPGHAIGNFQTGRFVVTSGTIFNSSRGDFSLDGESFYLRNVRADHKTGAAFLHCKYEPNNGRESLKFQTEVKMDPRVFTPFIRQEDTKRFLTKWQFKENSGVYIRAAGQSSNLGFSDVQGRGSIALQDFKLNDVPFQALETNVEVDGQKRWYRDVKFTRGDGTIEAKQVYTDTENRFWEISEGKSSINITEGIGAFSPKLEKWLSPYQFSQPPLLEASGKIDSRPKTMLGEQPRKTDIKIKFASPGSVSYPLMGKPIQVGQPKGVLSIKENRAHLYSAEGKIIDGDLKLELNGSIMKPEDTSIMTTLKLSKVDINRLFQLYGLESLFKGTIDGEIDISGDYRKINTLNGSGKTSIEQTDLLQLPTFKGLARLVKRDAILIGGHNVVSEMKLKNGILMIEKFVIPDSFQGSLAIDLAKNQTKITLFPDSISGYQYQASGAILDPKWETVPIKKRKPPQKPLAREAELD